MEKHSPISPNKPFYGSPTRLLRGAFAFESFLFTLESTRLILFPASHLLTLARTPLFITPISTYLARIWGSNALALALPLAWSASSYASPRERRLTYWMLGAADAFAITCGITLAITGVDNGMKSGLSWKLAIGQALPLCWRIYCLAFKPDWFEDSSDS
jgi:hypothetical protein